MARSLKKGWNSRHSRQNGGYNGTFIKERTFR